MNPSADLPRREFIRTAAATGVAVPYLVSSSALAGPGKPGANERLSIALIGCGGMGRGNLSACGGQPDVVVTGACDAWQQRREAVVAQFPSAKPYSDYRELLQRKDLDGVIIATPPHWHCLIAVDACRAGKDIYLQKPMTLHLAESLAVRNAVRKHQRVCQVGTSTPAPIIAAWWS
jgi:predicted dehydrogenase